MEKLLAPSFLFFLFIIPAIPIVVRGRGTLTDARFVVPQILLSSLLKTIGLNVERGIEREREGKKRKIVFRKRSPSRRRLVRLFEISTISTRGWRKRERERAVEPLRELTCIGVNLCSEGIYVRAKQVPGIEAPQYDNAITPLLRRFSRLLSLLPSFFFSSSPLSVVRNPVFLFSPRISLLYPCRLLPCCPPINITMRKYVRTSSFVLVSRPWLQSRRSSFPYFSIRLRGEKEKRKKRRKKKKKDKKRRRKTRYDPSDDRSRTRRQRRGNAFLFQGRGYRETAEVWPINMERGRRAEGAITIRLTGARFLLLFPPFF